MTPEDKSELDDAWDTYSYSIGKFDDQSLFISSGALGLSLSFIKDIVPFNESHHLFLFYLSIISFLVSIAIGFYCHYFSANCNKKLFDKILGRTVAADAIEIDKIQNDIYNFQKRSGKQISLMNRVILYTLVAGIFSLVFYCIINIEMNKNKPIIPLNHTNCIPLQSNK